MIRLSCCAMLVLGGLSLGAMPAQAASFDCGQAATPFEHAICDNPDLSAADERLAKTFATAIGGLSKSALSDLRGSQRGWLDYARRACTRTAEPMTKGRYDEQGVSCLVDLFAARSQVLESSRMIDGLRLYPIARYAAWPDPAEAGNPQSYWAVARHELAMVQIDADTGYAHALNDLVRAEGTHISGAFAPQEGAEAAEDDTSSDTTNTILVEEVAGDNRITLLVNTYWYGHGAAHGNYSISYRHYLKQQGRFLEARDLFAGDGWQQALLDLAVEAARAEHGDNLMLDDTSYIAEAVVDPSRWNLSDPYGLVIQFQPYEISSYAYGAPTARVSWAALEPYMTENADEIRFGY